MLSRFGEVLIVTKEIFATIICLWVSPKLEQQISNTKQQGQLKAAIAEEVAIVIEAKNAK